MIIDLVKYYPVLKPLILFIIGMFIYAWFIFKFYRFLAREDVFKLNLSQYNKAKHPLIRKFYAIILYLFEYIFLMPLFTFFWFGVLALLIAFLSKQPDPSNILLSSMALVGAVRISAYYDEALSQDLAKMLPFALLGVFIIDISFFEFSKSIGVIKEMVGLHQTLLHYFGFVVLLEFILRIAHGTKKVFHKEEKWETMPD